MPRTVRDARIETRSAREKLAIRHEPYWRAIDEGAHLGYRKGKRGGKWIARFRPQGSRYTKRVLGKADDTLEADGNTVLTYRHAQQKARDWFAEFGTNAQGADSGPYTVESAFKDYLRWFEANRKTVAKTTHAANLHILPELGDVLLSELTKERIATWHQAIAMAPARVHSGKLEPIKHRPRPKDDEGRRARKATANRILTILKAALNHAYDNDKVARDTAWRKVKPFRNVEASRVRYLSTDECKRLINASAPDFRKLVQAALFTGCRYGEIIAMQCDDYNSDSRTVTVRVSKGGKPRHVPLNDEGDVFFGSITAGREGTLFLRENGNPWKTPNQARPFSKAAEIANVKNASFHTLRHTYGSQLAMQGVPMGVIAAAMGHSDTRMTEKHYAHLAPSYVAEMIRANLPKFGIDSGIVTTLRR